MKSIVRLNSPRMFSVPLRTMAPSALRLLAMGWRGAISIPSARPDTGITLPVRMTL
jgi:hypothetical protein